MIWIMTRHRLLLSAMLCLWLTACSTDRVEDLRQYVAETKAKSRGAIEPMPKIAAFEVYTYTSENRREPFSSQTLISPTAKKLSGADTIQLDTTRRKEPLEAFSLDTLKLIGMIERSGEIWAIIKAPDAIVYWVKRGNYLGQNYGKIADITESKVDVAEMIPDASGGWRSRPASLVLAE